MPAGCRGAQKLMMNRTPTPRATRPLNSVRESTSTPATPLTQMLHGENASLSNTNQAPASAPPHSRTRMNEVNRSSEVSAENSSMYHQRSAPPNVGRQNQSLHIGRPQQSRISPERLTGDDSSRGPGFDQERHVFDICRRPSSSGVNLHKLLLEMNRENRKVFHPFQYSNQYACLRPGMVLLKNYIRHKDQVKVVQKCQELGIGVGGFYRPGYEGGANLPLQMCLGKNWDLESRKYEDMRPTDGATPPDIPEEFRKLVYGALKTSHGVIWRKNRDAIVDEEIPLMSPDICVVNFYDDDGRLGLHQDIDESEESLQKGLPVVSFSIGDSADFLYVDRSHKTERIFLESGDVLVFGGKSRRIFHGVPCITPKTCPKRLMVESNLKPGRLNLTFRKY